MTTEKRSELPCPVCGATRSRVKDTRMRGHGQKAIRRRRVCLNGHPFSTDERVVASKVVMGRLRPGMLAAIDRVMGATS